ncbi:hypothetical protein [Nocardia altamirensis]|uniref:hypothetical protein n=1 Tax=Nocardia altamirensis TaxID=472158 RepID=UPI00084076EA|nr:hypothetical protein [Nocardia altamirensis]
MDLIERWATVAWLWEGFLELRFPCRGGKEVAGICLTLLDLEIAGCVSTWLDNGGSLDWKRREILRHRITRLEEILPLLAGAELRYFEHLYQVAVLAARLDDSSDGARSQ